jgi:hypothetical protein
VQNLRRDSSCCRPAFTAAAAWREVEADLGVGDGVWPLKAVAASVLLDIVRAMADEVVVADDVDLEGGKEFRSGAISGASRLGQVYMDQRSGNSGSDLG